MSWLKRLFGDEGRDRVDYYQEGLELVRDGRHHEALTSFRLALRDSPADPAVLQQIAMTYTRIGMTEDAVKTYRTVLEHDPGAAGAHYGLAFLFLHEGRQDEAVKHLRSFLDSPPTGPEADRHITHARRTLEQLLEAADTGGGAGS